MYEFNISFSLICVLGLFFIEPSLAQNSPQDYLNAHNAARAAVRVGPLQWDRKLAAYAQAHANRHINDCKLVLSAGPYGENLARAGSNSQLSGAAAVKFWVSKRRFYSYKWNRCVGDESCLTYTQVVWRGSKKLGCGRVRCSNGATLIVCNYSPRGNIPSRRPY